MSYKFMKIISPTYSFDPCILVCPFFQILAVNLELKIYIYEKSVVSYEYFYMFQLDYLLQCWSIYDYEY